MFGKDKNRVLVAGAGPVGLFTAVALLERGVPVEIYDQDPRMVSRSYALALHPRTLQLLDDVGLAQTLIARGTKVQKMAFYDGKERKAEVDFAQIEGAFPFLLIVPQSVLEETLHEKLHEKHVKVKWNHRVQTFRTDGDRVVATLHKLDQMSLGYPISSAQSVVTKKFEHDYAFAVGSDGYGSQMRNVLELDYENHGEIGTFFVTEFEPDREVTVEAGVVLESGTSNVFWPIAPDRARWSFQVDLTKIEPPSEDELVAYIERRAPWFPARPRRVYWSTIVRFERRLAPRFGEGRVWLVGDSAHLTGPIGVQSLNVGMQEGHDLATRIANVLLAGEDLSTFDRFRLERLAEWRSLLNLNGHAGVEEGTDLWIAERAGRLLPAVPASGEDLSRLLAQIGVVWSVEPVDSEALRD